MALASGSLRSLQVISFRSGRIPLKVGTRVSESYLLEELLKPLDMSQRELADRIHVPTSASTSW